MKNIILLLIMFAVFSCKAQQEYPLKTDYSKIPNNSYLKDINNELDFFSGIWTAQYNGSTITLYVSAKEKIYFDRLNYKFYRDVLDIRFIVKNTNGQILQDTKTMSFSSNQIDHTIYSRWVDQNGTKLSAYYGGTNCGIGWGSIYLTKIDTTHINWSYNPNSSTITEQSCPGNQDLKVYIPVTDNLTFTKQ